MNPIISYSITLIATAATIASMQFKNMRYVLICQLLGNSLLGLKYVLEGTVSAGGVVFLAIIQTLCSFIFSVRRKTFPLWLNLLFMGGYIVITALCFANFMDIFPCLAVLLFAVGIVQRRSSICRFCSAVNTALWLVYDIVVVPSAILMHFVVLCFIVIGMIRLDRDDYRALFSKTVSKSK